jgi:hypothetical protein
MTVLGHGGVGVGCMGAVKQWQRGSGEASRWSSNGGTCSREE